VSTGLKKLNDIVKVQVIHKRSNVENTVPLRSQAFLKGGPKKS
jgi:hypothetical protein